MMGFADSNPNVFTVNSSEIENIHYDTKHIFCLNHVFLVISVDAECHMMP